MGSRHGLEGFLLWAYIGVCIIIYYFLSMDRFLICMFNLLPTVNSVITIVETASFSSSHNREGRSMLHQHITIKEEGCLTSGHLISDTGQVITDKLE